MLCFGGHSLHQSWIVMIPVLSLAVPHINSIPDGVSRLVLIQTRFRARPIGQLIVFKLRIRPFHLFSGSNTAFCSG